MRPLKFRLVAEMPTSLGPSVPWPNPMHGPQPGGRKLAPASARVFQVSVLLSLRLDFRRRRRDVELHALGDFLALENASRLAQIAQPRVDAA
jgi:hypothetical protein